MRVEQKNINALFRSPVQYTIPVYQRRYVWNVDNWNPLWVDIESNVEKKSDCHFTGAIVTREITKSQGNRQTVQKHEIIDGQQRLTTFQVILCAFKNLCESEYDEDPGQLVKRVDDHIKNPKSAVDGATEIIEGDSIERLFYKLIPTDYDSDAFRTLVRIEKGEIPQISEDTRHIIQKAYVYFRGKIKGYVGGDYERMKNLLNSFINRFEVAQINLNQKDRSQEIFLSINATGRGLSEFDYLRNDVFLRAGDVQECKRLYENYWSKFEVDPWTIEKLNAFFQVFLIAKCGNEVVRSDVKLFDIYQKNYQKKLPAGDQIPEYELSQLQLYAEVYKELDDPNSEIGSRMQFYKDLATYEEEGAYNSGIGFQHNRNIACVQSFILYLKNELKIPDEELYTVFDILESYVARRLILDTVDSRYAYETIEFFFSKMINPSNEFKFTVQNLIKYLAEVVGRKWISNDVVRNQFQVSGDREKGSGRRFQGSLLFTERYIFYRIENWKRIRIGKPELAFKDFLPTRERMINSRDLPKSAWRSLGNATFYTGENRTFINSFVQEKKLLSDSSNYELILNQEICTYKKWGRREILQREKDLLNCFYEIWPPAEEFKRAGRRSGKPKTLKWISTIQPSSDHFFRFFTYTSTPTRILSHLQVIQDKVQGIDSNGGEQLVEKSEILFICSEGAWNELLHHCVHRLAVRSRGLQPISVPARQLQLDDTILQSAQVNGLSVTAVTRLGHEFRGTIARFDNETICLQIAEHEVIVFRAGLLEFATEEWYNGVVEKWGTDDLFGYIKCSTNKFLHEQDIEVKSQFLDQRIDSRKLQPDLKVKFNLKIVEKDGGSHFQADNAVPVTTWQLHQGKVERFDPRKGSGFLVTEGFSSNIYLHKSQVIPKDINLLREEQQVEFNIAEAVEGRSAAAINVKVKRNKR